MLKLAKNSGLTDVISTDGSNPLTTQHPIAGSAVETRVFLFNDNGAKRYESITVDPTGTNESWVQLAPDNGGNAGTYLAGGAPLSMADVEDTAGHPFWVKVTTPTVGDTQNVTTIKLTVQGTEFAK